MSHAAKHRSSHRPAIDHQHWLRVVLLPLIWLAPQHLATGAVARLLICVGLATVVGKVTETVRQIRRKTKGPATRIGDRPLERSLVRW